MFGEGISKMSELIDLGVKLGIVQKSGAWFNYGDIRLGQGRDNAKQFLRDNPEIANDIEGQVRANADKLYATRRPGGKAAAAPAEGEPAAPATAKEPVVKAPAAARVSWISWWKSKWPFTAVAAARWPKRKNLPMPPRPAPGPWSCWPGRSFPRASCMSG